MSIREIWTQSHFAEIAFRNIDLKTGQGTDGVFSSIHSFLSHCANVSKMLAAKDNVRPPKSIGQILRVSASSVIHKRAFRNHLEHYDERLKKWIQRYGANATVGTYNVGPKSMFTSTKVIYISHYDPATTTFTFVNQDFKLDILHKEASRIKELSGAWVTGMEQGKIVPPFS